MNLLTSDAKIRTLFNICIICCMTLGLAGCGWVFSKKEVLPHIRKKDLGFPEVPYTTQFIFKKDIEHRQQLEEMSRLVRLEKTPPTSIKALYYRCKLDNKRLVKALQSQGFFDAKIKFRILTHKKKGGSVATAESQSSETVSDAVTPAQPLKQPVKIQVIITPGDQYKLQKIDHILIGNPQQVNVTSNKLARITKYPDGSPFDMNIIKDGVIRLKKYFQNHGFPFVQIKRPEGVLNRADKTISISVHIILNGYQKFGAVAIEGNDFIDENFVRNRLSWESGQEYDLRKINKTRQKLLEIGIFSRVVIEPEAVIASKPSVISAAPVFAGEEAKSVTIDGDGSQNVPLYDDTIPHDIRLRIKVDKGLSRTIGVGARYAKTDGIGAKTYWYHRNLWGGGEVAEALLNISSRDSYLKIFIQKPDVFLRDLSLIGRGTSRYERVKAYHGLSSSIYGGFNYSPDEYLNYSLGFESEYSHLKRDNEKQSARLLSFPMNISYDTTNDAMNPIKGGKVSLDLTPSLSKYLNNRYFSRLQIQASYYLRPWGRGDKIVIAFWGRGGIIASCKGAQGIPYNKRFYAGGINSVRGYGLQLLSPLTPSRTPSGGKTLLEFGVEPRVKINDKYGFVIFAEAARVGGGEDFHIDRKKILWGVGAGLRYYTAIGPVRLDVAVPLERRRIGGRTVDSSYQLYVSIGQAF